MCIHTDPCGLVYDGELKLQEVSIIDINTEAMRNIVTDSDLSVEITDPKGHPKL